MSLNNYQSIVPDLPFLADADMSSSGFQYRWVTVASTAGYVIRGNGASTPHPLGVLQNDPKQGEEAQIRYLGVSFLEVNADTAIGYGDYLTCSSTGHGTINTNGSSVGAMALQAVSSGSVSRIPVLLIPFGSGNKADNTA